MGLSLLEGAIGVSEQSFQSLGNLIRPIRDKLIEGVLITHLSPGELTSLGYLWKDRDTTVTSVGTEWVLLSNNRTGSGFQWKRSDIDQVADQMGITLPN